jgi:predicted dehydrogenase
VSETIRWGIAATGHIASKFVEDLALLDDATVMAVGSRSAERADTFADEFGIPGRHATYEALATDPEVDVVYVASPASRHLDNALLFLEAGKHVLCEKPFALNRAQATRMIDAARAGDRFLMEALWSRFLPAYVAVRERLAEGRIGETQFVEADFGFRLPVDPAHRLFDPAQGGGALLDLGIYPLQFATMVLGPVESVRALGQIGATGVDETTVVTLGHDGGALSVSKASIRLDLRCTARIAGSDGAIELPAFMHYPGHVTVRQGGAVVERVEASFDGNGLRFQASEVHRCLREGLTESPVMPAEETLRLATVLDDVRAQIGLRYPGEEAPAGP